VCDIRAIVSAAHAAGAIVCVDNSFMTPLFQRPLDLGERAAPCSGWEGPLTAARRAAPGRGRWAC
jgi:cystathionine gamma-lyase